MFRKYTAEFSDVHFHNIEEIQAGSCRLLWVKGLIMHSAMVADHIDLHPEQHCVNIQVAMALTQENKSGLFELCIPIPDRIAKITFGREHSVLWARTTERQAASEPQLTTQSFG